MEVNERVTEYEEDRYRWLYEVDMYRNPSIFLTVVKVVGICLCLPVGLILFLELKAGNSFLSILRNMKPIFITLAVVALITIVSYWFVAHMYSGKYCAIYEMDENGVTLIQLEEQFEKQQVIARLAALTGAFTGNIGLIGSGMLNMERKNVYSDFHKVYSVKGYRNRDLIKVNSPFLFNQIYVQKEDFDFVENYIREHCPKLQR